MANVSVKKKDKCVTCNDTPGKKVLTGLDVLPVTSGSIVNVCIWMVLVKRMLSTCFGIVDCVMMVFATL